MSIVKVKTKYQVTLPSKVRAEAGVGLGDVLEAKVEQGKITLTPQTLVDRQLAESLEDYKKGRFYGPFDTAAEMTASLKSKMKKRPRIPAVSR